MANERGRHVVVRFTDFLDDSPVGLNTPEKFAEWLRRNLEGLRDIQVESINIEDRRVVSYTEGGERVGG